MLSSHAIIHTEFLLNQIEGEIVDLRMHNDKSKYVL